MKRTWLAALVATLCLASPLAGCKSQPAPAPAAPGAGQPAGEGESAAPPSPNTPPPGGKLTPEAAACGVKAGEPLTQEACTCLGGRLNASRGGEQEHCANNESELGAVRFGLEGGWCCKQP